MRARSATSRSATGRTSGRALLASAGVKERSGTAPPYRRDDERRLALWLALVAALAALGYGTRAAAGQARPARCSTSGRRPIGGLIQDGIMLLIVLAIAGFGARLLALRRPDSSARAAGYMA